MRGFFRRPSKGPEGMSMAGRNRRTAFRACKIDAKPICLRSKVGRTEVSLCAPFGALSPRCAVSARHPWAPLMPPTLITQPTMRAKAQVLQNRPPLRIYNKHQLFTAAVFAGSGARPGCRPREIGPKRVGLIGRDGLQTRVPRRSHPTRPGKALHFVPGALDKDS